MVNFYVPKATETTRPVMRASAPALPVNFLIGFCIDLLQFSRGMQLLIANLQSKQSGWYSEWLHAIGGIYGAMPSDWLLLTHKLDFFQVCVTLE